MALRMSLMLGVLVLGACSTAQMAVDPQLNNNCDRYLITQMPGGGISFGPYQASNVHRSWTRGDGLTLGKYRKERRSQTYSFDFSGAGDWKADCKVKTRSTQIGRVGFEGISVDGSFTGTDSKFTLSFSGDRLVEGKGSFNSETETLRVVPTNEIQGSPFGLGTPSGYYVYSGSRIVAGVDCINGNGPVWLNKDLSPDDKDRVSMVIVLLLLVQE